MRNISKLIIAIIGCELVGLLGIPFTIAAIPTWYATLQKPFLNPPNWIFSPVWTMLYLLMGVATFLVWQKKVQGKNNRVKKLALQIFFFQLFLNFCWSFIFFYLHLKFFALIEIIVLWAAIFYTIVLFKKISRLAAWLMIPYLLWVSFATYLTLSIWILNH